MIKTPGEVLTIYGQTPRNTRENQGGQDLIIYGPKDLSGTAEER